MGKFVSGQGWREAESREPSTIQATRLVDGRLKCRHCRACTQFKLTCPASQTITVVAVTCIRCGEVAGYFDEQVSRNLLDGNGEQPADRIPREHVATHGIAHVNLRTDDAEKEIVACLSDGMSVASVAWYLEFSEAYVHAIGVKHKVIRKRVQ